MRFFYKYNFLSLNNRLYNLVELEEADAKKNKNKNKLRLSIKHLLDKRNPIPSKVDYFKNKDKQKLSWYQFRWLIINKVHPINKFYTRSEYWKNYRRILREKWERRNRIYNKDRFTTVTNYITIYLRNVHKYVFYRRNSRYTKNNEDRYQWWNRLKILSHVHELNLPIWRYNYIRNKKSLLCKKNIFYNYSLMYLYDLKRIHRDKSLTKSNVVKSVIPKIVKNRFSKHYVRNILLKKYNVLLSKLERISYLNYSTGYRDETVLNAKLDYYIFYKILKEAIFYQRFYTSKTFMHYMVQDKITNFYMKLKTFLPPVQYVMSYYVTKKYDLLSKNTPSLDLSWKDYYLRYKMKLHRTYLLSIYNYNIYRDSMFTLNTLLLFFTKIKSFGVHKHTEFLKKYSYAKHHYENLFLKHFNNLKSLCVTNKHISNYNLFYFIQRKTKPIKYLYKVFNNRHILDVNYYARIKLKKIIQLQPTFKKNYHLDSLIHDVSFFYEDHDKKLNTNYMDDKYKYYIKLINNNKKQHISNTYFKKHARIQTNKIVENVTTPTIFNNIKTQVCSFYTHTNVYTHSILDKLENLFDSFLYKKYMWFIIKKPNIRWHNEILCHLYKMQLIGKYLNPYSLKQLQNSAILKQVYGIFDSANSVKKKHVYHNNNRLHNLKSNYKSKINRGDSLQYSSPLPLKGIELEKQYTPSTVKMLKQYKKWFKKKYYKMKNLKIKKFLYKVQNPPILKYSGSKLNKKNYLQVKQFLLKKMSTYFYDVNFDDVKISSENVNRYYRIIVYLKYLRTDKVFFKIKKLPKSSKKIESTSKTKQLNYGRKKIKNVMSFFSKHYKLYIKNNKLLSHYHNKYFQIYNNSNIPLGTYKKKKTMKQIRLFNKQEYYKQLKKLMILKKYKDIVFKILLSRKKIGRKKTNILIKKYKSHYLKLIHTLNIEKKIKPRNKKKIYSIKNNKFYDFTYINDASIRKIINPVFYKISNIFLILKNILLNSYLNNAFVTYNHNYIFYAYRVNTLFIKYLLVESDVHVNNVLDEYCETLFINNSICL